MANVKNPFGIGGDQFLPYLLKVSFTLRRVLQRERYLIFPVASQTVPSDIKGTKPFLKRLLEGSADGHGLTDGLHRDGEGWIGSWKFFKGESRDFHYTVVDGRFEGGGSLLGDIIGNLV